MFHRTLIKVATETYTIEQLRAHGRKLSVSTPEYPDPVVIEDSEDEDGLPAMIPDYFVGTPVGDEAVAAVEQEDPCMQPDVHSDARLPVKETDWDQKPNLVRDDDSAEGNEEVWHYADMPYGPVKSLQGHDQEGRTSSSDSFVALKFAPTHIQDLSNNTNGTSTAESGGHGKDSKATASDTRRVSTEHAPPATIPADAHVANPPETDEGTVEAISGENGSQGTADVPKAKKVGWIEAFRRMVLG